MLDFEDFTFNIVEADTEKALFSTSDLGFVPKLTVQPGDTPSTPVAIGFSLAEPCEGGFHAGIYYNLQ